MVAKKSEREILVITSSSIKTFDKKDNKEIDKSKILITTEEKKKKEELSKKIKQIKKISNAEKLAHFYETNSTSDASFQITNSILKQATSNQNNNNSSFINETNNWVAHLHYYQSKENILYLFYQSKKVDNTLFARPPPTSC